MIIPATAREVIEYVVDQGRLTKEQVMESWGIEDTDYRELQDRVLRDGRIELGPRRSGGFVLKTRRSRKVVDVLDGDQPLLPNEWEVSAVRRLEELLTRAELEDLLGKLKDDLRRSRYAEYHIDRPSTVRELAVALVLQRGIDLFCGDLELRSKIAAKCGIPPLKRWHPGKGAAIEFVKQAGFPPELAGIPSPDTLEDVEYLEEGL